MDRKQLREAIRDFAMSLPEAHGKSPWEGHDDVAVRDKTFFYLNTPEVHPLRFSCKLPYTCEAALELSYAVPTGYGLGKSGWVTFTPGDADLPSIEQVRDWIDESYRAQAPRRLVKRLDERAG